MAPMVPIRPVEPRRTVQARLPDGRVYEAAPGTPVGDVLEVAVPAGDERAAPMAALIDGRLRELPTPLTVDATVIPITLADMDGIRIYRRSLTLLLVTATAELFPDASVFVEHSAPTLGAYFCRVRGRAAFSSEDLARIEARMQEIADRDEPIAKEKVSRDEAIAIFQARGEDDKARLLTHRQQDSLVLHQLRARRDYFQGYLLPSTRHLRGSACTIVRRASCSSTRINRAPRS